MADDISRTWDSAVELAEPEALNLAFSAASAKLNGQKGKLLSSLRTTYDRAPRAQPFDAERAWRGIELITRLYVAPDIAKSLDAKLREREARDDEIADALKKARAQTERAMAKPDLGVDLALPWWETFGAEGVFTIDNESNRATAMIGVYEEAARQAGGKGKSRGKSKQDLVLPWLIGQLIGVYREATGAEPKPDVNKSGPFLMFAGQFLAAIGRRRGRTSIFRAAKAALKQDQAVRERAEANPIEGLGF